MENYYYLKVGASLLVAVLLIACTFIMVWDILSNSISWACVISRLAPKHSVGEMSTKKPEQKGNDGILPGVMVTSPYNQAGPPKKVRISHRIVKRPPVPLRKTVARDGKRRNQ